MATSAGWVTANRVTEVLGIEKKELFEMRDDGTFKLGPHYAAFPETMSRDSYRWHLSSVVKHLKKIQRLPETYNPCP